MKQKLITIYFALISASASTQEYMYHTFDVGTNITGIGWKSMNAFVDAYNAGNSATLEKKLPHLNVGGGLHLGYTFRILNFDFGLDYDRVEARLTSNSGDLTIHPYKRILEVDLDYLAANIGYVKFMEKSDLSFGAGFAFPSMSIKSYRKYHTGEYSYGWESYLSGFFKSYSAGFNFYLKYAHVITGNLRANIGFKYLMATEQNARFGQSPLAAQSELKFGDAAPDGKIHNFMLNLGISFQFKQEF